MLQSGKNRCKVFYRKRRMKHSQAIKKSSKSNTSVRGMHKPLMLPRMPRPHIIQARLLKRSAWWSIKQVRLSVAVSWAGRWRSQLNKVAQVYSRPIKALTNTLRHRLKQKHQLRCNINQSLWAVWTSLRILLPVIQVPWQQRAKIQSYTSRKQITLKHKVHGNCPKRYPSLTRSYKNQACANSERRLSIIVSSHRR